MQPRDSSAEDIDALHALCERLAGFDASVSLEWLDGCMAALLCGPRRPAPEEWLPRLLDDSWERTFADPQDHDQAMAVLRTRWQVLASQLDAEALFDDPDLLRLSPLIAADDSAERDRLLAEGSIDDEEASAWPLLGEVWALGVLDALDAYVAEWPAPQPGDEPAFGWYEGALRSIAALTLRDEARLQLDLQQRHPGRQPSRDELVDEACMALQDLRCYWVENAPTHAPRRVEPVPGRNDPCPCGSGRKFKKCHGAA